MNNPLVSIVLPFQNRKAFLSESISSLLAQAYQPFEIIAIDGKSSDGSADFVQSFDEVRYFLQEKAGIANAWNQGIREAKGEYIAFMADDDIWEPSKLQKQVASFDPPTTFLCSLTLTNFFFDKPNSPPANFRKNAMEDVRPYLILEALMVHRSVFELIGNFDTGITSSQDVDWFARLKDNKIEMAVVSEPLLRKRIHGGNFTYSLDMSEANDTLLSVIRNSIERKRSGLGNKKASEAENGNGQ